MSLALLLVARTASAVIQPLPVFVTPNPGQPATIYLGDTFEITLRVRNEARASDDGRISVSFPSFTDPTDAARVTCSKASDLPGFVETPVGGTLPTASCGSIAASYLVAEYVDNDWKPLGTETNAVTFTVRPSASGTFEFYVRSTMHAADGPACDVVGAVPGGGDAGYADQQGWPVKRFALTVLPPLTRAQPVFVGPVSIQGDPVNVGETVRISVVVRNDGGLSDDGRIVIGFPTLTEATDDQLVSSTSGGDSPGYREIPVGGLSTDSLCVYEFASYVSAEYVDSDWARLGAETDTLVVTVRPPKAGTFVFDVRSTMRGAGYGACNYANAAPAGGGSLVTDARGWTVRRFAITVLPSQPQPEVVMSRTSSSTVSLGSSFTFDVTVTNMGGESDDGRVVVSFPELWAASDTQLVSVTKPGGDRTGIRVIPAGNPLPVPGCTTATALYATVVYTDDAWAGRGADRQRLQFKVRPQYVGYYRIQVRSSMHWIGHPCSYVNGVPVAEYNATDSEGLTVGVFTAQVVEASLPPEITGAGVAGIPSSILLGESFTFAMSARNNGKDSNDGRISFSFPTLTQPDDSLAVILPGAATASGYFRRAAGSALTDSSCRAITARYLVAEYADAAWTRGETDALVATVQPRRPGTFYIDVRATLRDVNGTCTYLNSIPTDTTVVWIDQQGWAVRRYAVTVIAPPVATSEWHRLNPPPGGPSARSWTTPVYDAKRHALIIYGGYDQLYKNDVWTLPLDDGGRWSQILPGGPTPTRRLLHTMVINPIDDQVMIFGGEYAGYLNDLTVMTLSPVTWWFPNPGNGAPPSARSGHMAVLDPVRNRMLVIGGYDGQLKNDVWEYAPPGIGTWRELTPLGNPMPPRSRAAAVYDPVRDRVVIVGGSGNLPLNDVWALNLSGGDPTWEELHPSGARPSPRSQHSAVYDSVGDRIIVYGGFDGARRGDLWALNLKSPPSWEMLASRTLAPVQRYGQAAIYDAARKRMVIFGGQIGPTQYSSEVWALEMDAPTPVAISLASTEVQSDLVRITWAAEGAANLGARVHRTVDGSNEWIDLGKPTIAGADRLVIEDRDVTPGTRYGYRLAVMDGGEETLSEPAWVTVPHPAVLALAGAMPNPSEGLLSIRFALPGNGPATLELFDLKGRRVAYREVGSMGPGEHTLPFIEQPHLPAGVYLVRLTRDGRVLTAKACVVK